VNNSMAAIVQIDSDLANAIAGIVLAAANTGLIDAVTSDQYRAALMPASQTIVRKFTWIIPAVTQTAQTPGVVALCDDGNIYETTDVTATPVVWVAKGGAPQT